MPKLTTIIKMTTLSLCVGVFAAFNPVFAESKEPVHHAEHPHEETNIDWPGVYNGFTPCSDCFGVKTTLALNKNNTYLLMTTFAGRSEREFVEKGKYEYNVQNKYLVLTPRNSEETRLYAVADDALIQLDSKGKYYTGKESDRYVLKRNDIKPTTPSHGH